MPTLNFETYVDQNKLYNRAQELAKQYGIQAPGLSSEGNKYSSKGEISFNHPYGKLVIDRLKEEYGDQLHQEGAHEWGTQKLHQDWAADKRREQQQREKQWAHGGHNLADDRWY